MEEPRDKLPPNVNRFAPWRWDTESLWELLGWCVLYAFAGWAAYYAAVTWWFPRFGSKPWYLPF